MNLANEEEAEVWNRIMDIAGLLREPSSLALEHYPGKRFDLLKAECQRDFKLAAQRKKIEYDDSRRPDADKSVVEQYCKRWNLAESQWETVNAFFDKHEAEIKEWLREKY